MESKDIRNIVVISNLELNRFEGAGFSRVLCYSKSLQGKGVKFYFTCLNDVNNINTKSLKELDKNIFYFANAEHSRQANIPNQYFDYFHSIKYCRKIINFINTVLQGETIILLYSYNLTLTLVTLFLSKKFGIKVICEKNELWFSMILNFNSPESLLKKILFIPIQFKNLISYLMIDLVEIFSDGIITISTRLFKLYSKFNINVIRIPILSDFTNYKTSNSEIKENTFNIGFTGYIGKKKDDIFILIFAIHKLKNKFPDIILNIYGFLNSSMRNKLNKIISRLSLHDNIIINNPVKRNKIPDILIKQNLLVLLRRKNLQNQYGFSTKLAEYLSSGVPVLISEVSDNKMFLVDNYNAFYLKKMLTGDITDKIKSIIKSKSLCNTVGRNGKITAEINFNYKNYTDKMYNFFFNNNSYN
jgi:glycosyltransferase involved in cell wall biosynthesis